MANRIKQAIIEKAIELKAKLESGELTQEEIDKSHKGLDMRLDEYCMFQNLKSESWLNKILNLNEANYIYGLLGETPDTFNSQPIQVKVVLTQLYNELLGIKIRLKRGY